MGFKPIFEEERNFLQDKLRVELPTDCWRNSSKIYLDFTQPKPYLEFKVEDGQIRIAKDNRNGYKDKSQIKQLPIQKKLTALIEDNRVRLTDMYEKAVFDTVNMIKENPNYLYVVSHSGGKDSTLVYNVWTDSLDILKQKNISEPEWVINFANTSNDTADTYRFVKRLPSDKLNILNPQIGFYNWITDVKKGFIPSIRVRNCCSTYKEGQINKVYDHERDTIMITGVRAKESTKRAGYKMVMDYKWRKNHFGASNLPPKWTTFAPLCDDWADEDVWLYILMNNIEFNRMYRLGFHRVGCLICPFQQDYIDLLIEYYYPKAWRRWLDILEKNYDVTYVKDNLKWSLDEWQHGKWKQALSKEYFIIGSKPTKERVQKLAEIKGISEDMAKKYFQKVCICGKKISSPTEIAMFYKLKGRLENQDDNRPVLCKKCLCQELDLTGKQYDKMAREFREDGCNLF